MPLDYPSSPTNGQIYLNWQWDGVKWSALPNSGYLTDAPIDGSAYGRLNAAWTKTLPLTGGTLTGGLTISDSAAGTQASLTLSNTVAAAGVGLKLTSSGTSAKTIRVLSNVLQVIDRAYSNILFSVDDTGVGTFSGPVTTGTNTTSATTLTVNGAVGTKRSLVIQTAGKNRWTFTADSSAETGGNAGSNLAIQSWDDAGATNPATALFAGRDGTAIMNNVFVTGLFASAGLTVASSGPTIRAGTGAATGTQPSGSLWLRTDGAAGTRIYVSAGGGTWAAIAGV